MTNAAQKLNVVFHGMFAFIFWNDHIEVLAPEEDDHMYRAGSWGRERRLREGGVYALDGVTPSKTPIRLDPTKNLVLSRLTNINRDPRILFCSFTFPLPESMTGLRHVKLEPARSLFGGAASKSVSITTLPLIQVFTYQVGDFAKLRFNPLPLWTPTPGPQGIANLHVWGESDSVFTEDDRDHPMRGFEQLTSLFPDLDLQLLYSTGAPMDGSVQVPGMEVWEQATLRERSRLMFGGLMPLSGERGAEVTNCLNALIDNRD